MRILVNRRGALNPEQVLEFGTNLGPIVGLTIRIRLADLYHGRPIPAGANANDEFVVDLQQLQSIVLENLPGHA